MDEPPIPHPDEPRLDRYLRDSYPGLVARLRGSFSERIAAEDVVQEALVSAWQLEGRGERIHSLDPWMTAAATNLARSRWRTLQAEERALERVAADPLIDPSAALDQPPALRFEGVVADAIRALPPRQAQVVLLHYFGDLTMSETAVRLGVSEGAVKSALHDARGRLGSLLRDDQPHDKRRQMMIGWHMAGSHPKQYDHELTEKTAYGKPVARLWCTARRPDGFGTLMQTFSSGNYLERRLRFSGAVQCEGVEDWVGLWMRVDGARGVEPLAFDNMESRPIDGTRDWQRYNVVLDVPSNARAVALGVLLSGRGEVAMADFGLETVGEDVPTTNMYEAPPEGPQNLDFSEAPDGEGS
ncbi:MAG: RNA polymerase sigma factor [Thermoleophilaceae bacterium]|nr:RNA polymerase sigma factor [Thermoleophilaceae bacterium]